MRQGGGSRQDRVEARRVRQGATRVRENSEERLRGKRGGFRRTGQPPKFLDRAEADAIGFAEGSVDGASFGDTHLGAADEWGNI